MSDTNSTPKLYDKPPTLYAVVNMDGRNKVMEFVPEAPMYLQVVAAGIGFHTREHCQKYCDASQEAEDKYRKEEEEFLNKKEEEAN